jgi:6-phosphogluconolactonase (cycloisomerase 2 family)
MCGACIHLKPVRCDALQCFVAVVVAERQRQRHVHMKAETSSNAVATACSIGIDCVSYAVLLCSYDTNGKLCNSVKTYTSQICTKHMNPFICSMSHVQHAAATV